MTRLRNHLAGQSIDSRIAPSAITFRKILIRLSDLPHYLTGFKIVNLGATSEVRIFSDFPIDIKLGDSLNAEKYRTDLFFRGNISRIQLATRNVDTAGVVVIYVGDPYLGVDWQRETPTDKGTIAFDTNPTLVSGINFVDAGVPSLFAFDGVTGYGMEAMYLRSLSFARSVGNIERIVYRESETGLNRNLFDHRFKNPTSDGVLTFDTPYRISARGDFRFYGSKEIVDSIISSTITGGFI